MSCRLAAPSKQALYAYEESIISAFQDVDNVTTQSQPFQSYLNLYKAMGGGWVEEAEKIVGNGISGNAAAK